MIYKSVDDLADAVFNFDNEYFDPPLQTIIVCDQNHHEKTKFVDPSELAHELVAEHRAELAIRQEELNQVRWAQQSGQPADMRDILTIAKELAEAGKEYDIACADLEQTQEMEPK